MSSTANLSFYCDSSYPLKKKNLNQSFKILEYMNKDPSHAYGDTKLVCSRTLNCMERDPQLLESRNMASNSILLYLLASDALQKIISAAMIPPRLDIKGNLQACPTAVKARRSVRGCLDLVPAWAIQGFSDVTWSLPHAGLTHWSNQVQLSVEKLLQLRWGSSPESWFHYEMWSSIICYPILLHLWSLNQEPRWLADPGISTDLLEYDGALRLTLGVWLD